MTLTQSAALTQDAPAAELLANEFDAVIMFTWSNWHTEPRSNRYHYATRFAKLLPVLFVQPWELSGSKLRVEATGVEGLELLHSASDCSKETVAAFLDLLRRRGIRRPLLWIYDCYHYQPLIDALPNAYAVYHATEDYFTPSEGWSLNQQAISEALRRLLHSSIDLVVAVSDGVATAYRDLGDYGGKLVVAENGCDHQFLADLRGRVTADPNNDKVAIFQGGINKRLDFDLLHGLVHQLPDWKFWFCGKAQADLEGWKLLLTHPNVIYFGELQAHEFSEKMCMASVGLIPYIADDWIWNSLPLKAYEYVACGLPVVTVPIEALGRQPALFQTATTVEEFAAAIAAAAPTRHDPEMLRLRDEGAARVSYDARFAQVQRAILQGLRECRERPVAGRLNAVMLYDDRSTHVSTIAEHAEAFALYSRHNFHYMPATGGIPYGDAWPEPDLSSYDVAIVHYSIRVSIENHLSEAVAKALENFHGLKVLFIQDEYDTTEVARKWMDRIGFDIVYTCVPAPYLEYVYPRARFPFTDFLPTLTGYVPEDPHLDKYQAPLRDRKVRIAYRGRMLPYFYGSLGWQKYKIGVDVRKLADERGLDVDIEVDDSKRIYGADWYRFLGTARSTLGTESGSNVFDFDGTLRGRIDDLLRAQPGASFDDVHCQLLEPLERNIKMNQISPKIFEAVRLGTALVLFEGEYSGVLEAGVHYIALRQDYSNIDEVFAKLEDLDYLEQLTSRAYRDIIGSGRYSYRNFVVGVDRDLEARYLHRPRCQLYSVPAMSQSRSGILRQLSSVDSQAWLLLDSILKQGLKRETVVNDLPLKYAVPPSVWKLLRVEARRIGYVCLRFVWRLLPQKARYWISRYI
ncbi:putative teichuronic acid biosynthesis glycosyltransferase TuaH [compost metagenome]